MGFSLVNEEATVPLLITLSPKTLGKQYLEFIKMGLIIFVLFLLVDVLKDNVLKVMHCKTR
jgi:hypothetical protein